jgi:hypothetical protein
MIKIHHLSLIYTNHLLQTEMTKRSLINNGFSLKYYNFNLIKCYLMIKENWIKWKISFGFSLFYCYKLFTLSHILNTSWLCEFDHNSDISSAHWANALSSSNILSPAKCVVNMFAICQKDHFVLNKCNSANWAHGVISILVLLWRILESKSIIKSMLSMAIFCLS